MVSVLLFFLFVVLVTVLVPSLVVIVFLHELSLREGKLLAGLLIARIWNLLPRWLLVRLGGYGRCSTCYRRVTATNSLQHSSAEMEGLDPFSLVSDELTTLADRLRTLDVVKVPDFAPAVQYYFKPGAEGKMFRPTVLLLMATALRASSPKSRYHSLGDTELRKRQQLLAEIIEMIHVASLVHDDILDDADTRRGVRSLNLVMGNKIAVLAGDFLLARASVTLASLKDFEVVSLIATAIENLVIGETMQATTSSDQRFSMEYYMQKTYCKTASLISNSCKAIAVLAGQMIDVSTLAYEYGKNLGLSFQLIDDVLDFNGTLESLGKGSLSDLRQGIITAPILFAIEEYPQLREVIEQGDLDDPAAISLAVEYLGKSSGIQKAKDLAKKHADLAAEAIDALPYSDDDDVRRSRRALVDLTNIVITRTK